MTKEIPLTQGKVAIVDDDVYEWASQYRWYAMRDGNRFYAVRKKGGGTASRVAFLHREIVQPPADAYIDHKNGDGLDCRRTNMRLANHAENVRNSRIRSDNTSGFKGVHRDKGKWCATIKAGGIPTYLGRFDSAEAAALAYDDAARKYYGEFAKTNF